MSVRLGYTTVSALVLTLLTAGGVQAQWLKDQRELMGTQVTVELWAEEITSGEKAIDQVFDEVKRLDEMMNPWNPGSE